MQESIRTIVPNNQEIVCLNSDTKASQCLQTLIEKKIHSAPVIDVETQKYLGFLDLVDIVALFVKIYKETEMKDIDFYEKVTTQNNSFEKETAASLVDLSQRNPFIPLEKDITIMKAIELMGEKRIQRIPIMENEKIVNILSQSTMIEWLEKNKSLYDCSKTIGELGLGIHQVYSVELSQKAIEAFTLMAEHQVSAVALLDEDGTLFSNLSSKDLKAMEGKVLFEMLYKTTLEFAAASRSKEVKAFSTAITCHPEDSLEKVIGKLAATKIHRIYIIDDQRKPIGILTLSDILKAILEQCS